MSNPPRNQEKLKAETLHGCVYIPAKGFVQRLVVGVEKTGESCSVTVNPDNTVEVSFLGDGVIPVVSTNAGLEFVCFFRTRRAPVGVAVHDVSENGTGVGETRGHVAGGSEGVQGMPVVERSEMAVAHCGAQRAALR